MDFFTQQEHARRKTKWLVGYFALAVIGITASVYLVVSVALTFIQADRQTGYGRHSQHYTLAENPEFRFRADVLGWVSLGTLLVIGAGTLWRMSELSSGGASIATMLGGRPINANTSDPDERKLLNVVEEMAIASGVPVPKVFLLPDDAINAFAAGYRPSDAVVGVTRGCMKLLNRDELQGVIAHEFSHILNGDMRLNLRLVAWIFGIMGLALVGRILLEARGRKNALPLLGLALMLIGWIGVLFGRLIQSAISRQREFLADASAVQFTRNPQGLANALKKIGGLSVGSRLQSAQAGEVSHLFFANGLTSSFMTPFATHPPLEARIRAIEPDWDGRFSIGRPAPEEAQPAPRGGGFRQRTIPLPTGGVWPRPVLANQIPSRLAEVGQMTPATLDYAADWRGSLPQEIDRAARDPFSAEAIVFALLLSRNAMIRERQISQITNIAGEPSAAEALRLAPTLEALGTGIRLPLVDLALPALRELSESQYQVFNRALQALIEADEQIDLFEYTLQRVVRRHLSASFEPVRRRPAQYYVLAPLLPECGVLLKLLAHVGATKAGAAEQAWRAGWSSLGHPSPALPPASAQDLVAFDAALGRLNEAAPQVKKSVLAAVAYTVVADGEIREKEAELLRAIADTLDVPVPPFVQGSTARP